MIDAMYNGISGLNVFEVALTTETNNISNVNTVGYKSDNISFEDHMYQSQIGKGVGVAVIDKKFNQGDLKVTNGTYDLALEGKGFFIVKGETNEVHYTRAGNFKVASDGTLRLPNNYLVQGIPATSSQKLSTDADAIFTSQYSQFLSSQILKDPVTGNIETINAKATNFNITAQNDDIANYGNNYKTASNKILDVEALSTEYRNELSILSTRPNVASVSATKQTSEIDYDLSQITNEFDRIEIYIGNKKITQSFRNDATTTLKDLSDRISSIELFSARVDANGKLTIESMLPGKSIKIADAKIINGTITANPLPVINTTDALVGSGQAKLDSVELALKTALESAGAKFLRVNNLIDESVLSTTTIGDLQMKLTTLNIAENPFGKISIEDGSIYVNQDENKYIVGKITTAVFVNELGLNPQGNNLYVATRESGAMAFSTNENRILSKTLELSNSNLSESLVALMTLQRSFQASSRSVTTSDEFLKTAIQLKK